MADSAITFQMDATGLQKYFDFAPKETRRFMQTEWGKVNAKSKKKLQNRLYQTEMRTKSTRGFMLSDLKKAVHSSSGTPRPHLRDSIKTVSKFSGTDTFGGYAKVTYEGSFRGPKYAKNVYYLGYWYEWGSFKAGVRRTKEGWIRGRMPAEHPVEKTRAGKESEYAAATERALDRLASM